MRLVRTNLQAIGTKYFGPTNHRGSRIKATTASGLYVYSEYDSGRSIEENHFQAALKLIRKLEWNPDEVYAGGWKPGQYVFTMSGTIASVEDEAKYRA